MLGFSRQPRKDRGEGGIEEKGGNTTLKKKDNQGGAELGRDLEKVDRGLDLMSELMRARGGM